MQNKFIKISLASLFIFSFSNTLFSQIIANPDTTISLCSPTCVTLRATVTPPKSNAKSTTTYKMDQTITYAPEPFDSGTIINVPRDSVVGSIPIGFTFCFFGEPYTKFYVSSSGWISFSPWKGPKKHHSSSPLPNKADSTYILPYYFGIPKNAVLLSWSDMEKSNMRAGSGIYYKVYGTAPYRKLVVSWNVVVGPGGFFSFCGGMGLCYTTGQIVLYETTNVIENFIQFKPVTNTVTSEVLSVEGLHNKDGSVAIIVPGRNNTAWPSVLPNMTNDAVRFTPDGPPDTTYNIKWLEGNKLIAKDTTRVSVCPTTTTTYTAWVTYNTCPPDSFFDTATVSVVGNVFKVKAGNDTLICKGKNSTLQAQGGTKTSYSWTPTSSLNNPKIANPVATPTITTTYIVSAFDSVCSLSDKDTVVITVDSVNAVITGKDSICKGDSIVLDAGNHSSYLWSTNETTQKITVKTSGSYTNTVTNTNGCKGTPPPKIITVNPNPTPTITPLGPTTFCLGDSVILDAGTYSTYSWSTKETTKKITIKTSGIFTDTVTDANGCKGVSSPVTITISPNLNVNISGTTLICKGDSTVLTAAGAPRYVWNGNAKDTLSKLTTKPTVDSTYIVVGTSTSGKCQGSDTVVVIVNPLPAADVGPDLQMCAGERVTLNVSGNQAYAYSWTPATLNDTIAVSPIANPNTTTIYIAKITDKTTNCVGYDTVQVTVNPLPSVDAGSDITITSEETTTLKAITLSPGVFIWTPVTGLNCPNCQNTDANPQQTTKYNVSLTDTNGCKASDSVVVYKTCGDLYIPNAFSPNGDSLNDFFSVYQIGYTKFQMFIFDKWGEKIYETDNINKPWDGKVKDENAQQDVYVYIINAWDCFSKEHKYMGHVTLLR